jgi:serine/threonine protein kinase
MRFVHSQGFIHRDLKPSNILINEDGHALISDFGTTRPVEADHTATPDVGTVQYAAPELFLEDQQIATKRSDIFSFGLVLYEILVGCPVFPSSEYAFPVMRKLLKGDMPPIPDRVGNLMQGLIGRCWSLDPEKRPTFDDILNEFEVSQFAILPGASPDTIKEYFCSVKAWEDTPTE